jgi:hypothetical protein
MPKTKRYREARAHQHASGATYMQALAIVSVSGGGAAGPPSTVGRPPFEVDCPSCDNGVLILGDGDPRCEQCGYTKPGEDVADDYLEAVCGISQYETAKDGGEWPCYVCPECGCTALVLMEPGETVPNPNGFVCFGCGLTWGERGLERCCECNEFKELGEEIICDHCWQEKMRRDD